VILGIMGFGFVVVGGVVCVELLLSSSSFDFLMMMTVFVSQL